MSFGKEARSDSIRILDMGWNCREMTPLPPFVHIEAAKTTCWTVGIMAKTQRDTHHSCTLVVDTGETATWDCVIAQPPH